MKPEEIKEKIEEIEEKMPKYLAEKDLKNLDVYVYHSAEYTLVEKTLNPFWTWFASCFPDTMAPNMITLIGLLINITASFTVLFNDPTLEGKAPSWMYVLASFALITYLNFDCADGKQARRLHASSPLGQLNRTEHSLLLGDDHSMYRILPGTGAGVLHQRPRGGQQILRNDGVHHPGESSVPAGRPAGYRQDPYPHFLSAPLHPPEHVGGGVHHGDHEPKYVGNHHLSLLRRGTLGSPCA